MNVVHRCRFTEWQPSAVISLAIAPSGTRFAALRVNGNIEVWTQIVQENPDSVLAVNDNGAKVELSSFLSRFQPLPPNAPDSTALTLSNTPPQLAARDEHVYRYASMYYLSTQWVCTLQIPGTGKNVFSQLLWSYIDPVCNPHLVPGFNPLSLINTSNLAQQGISMTTIVDRLFTLGTNGRIVEWDLISGLPKFSTQSHGRALLCGTISPSGTQMAVGCQDGTIRIFKIADANSEPVLLRTLTRHKMGVISIDWLHFAHIQPQQPAAALVNHRPGTVRNNNNQRVESSSWWDPPLIASGGADGHIKVWNAVTGACTLDLKADAIRFDANKNSKTKKNIIANLKASGNKRFTKEIGLKNVAVRGKSLSGNEARAQLRTNLARLNKHVKEQIQLKREKLQTKMPFESLAALKDKKGKKKLDRLRGEDNMFDTDSDEYSDEDDEDEDGEDMMGDDEDDEGLSDDEKVDYQEMSEDEDDIGLMPTEKQKINSKKTSGGGKAAMKANKLKQRQLRQIIRSGGRVKTANHIIKLKWLDVETIVCLDQTSHMLIVNARTGVISTQMNLQQSLVAPTDIAVVPATLHTRSIAHKFNPTYNLKYSYQVHPNNIIPGQEQQLLSQLFTQPTTNSTQLPNPNDPSSNEPQYIPAYKSKQVYIPYPLIYVAGVNGRVVEFTGTSSVDLMNNATQSAPISPFAHASKFLSTGLHGTHTHDILALALAPTLVNTYNNNSEVQQRPTAQLTLLSSGVDTVITNYSVHPFNINDVSVVKSYFQYLKPVKLKLLSRPPDLTLSNYTSPWSHHWTMGKHQTDYTKEQLEKLIQNCKDHNNIHSNFVNDQLLLQKKLIETSYHIKTIPGVGTLSHYKLCLCPKCKMANIPSILNSNLFIRLLYSLHLLPSTHQTTFNVNVSNIGNGKLMYYNQNDDGHYVVDDDSVELVCDMVQQNASNTSVNNVNVNDKKRKKNRSQNDQQSQQQQQQHGTIQGYYYEPNFIANKNANDTIQTSLLSYIPLNSLELTFQNNNTVNIDQQQQQKKINKYASTVRIYSPRLISLLKSSPTLQFAQQQAPNAPIFASPKDFGIDIYTLTNHDQLIVRDSLLTDNDTQMSCNHVHLNNILCDMQLYQGTVVLDRNAVISTLLTMYTLRNQQQQHFLRQKERLAKENLQSSSSSSSSSRPNSNVLVDPHLQALEKEFLHHQVNPHLFLENDKLGNWSFYEPAFGITQHPSATYQSTTPTVDNPDVSKRAAGTVIKDENTGKEDTVRVLTDGRTIKIPSTQQLPNYVLSLHLALANISATTTTKLSPNGRFLLTSDATNIKLFGLTWPSKSSNQSNPHAISPKKIQFPPPVPSLTQYLRSVFDLQSNRNDDNTTTATHIKNHFDLSSIPDYLYEQCVEEHHYISLYSQLLSENGCQTATFSPCSSMLAVSLSPYAGALLPQPSSSIDIFNLPSETEVSASQYPHLGTVILIDLITYQIIGYMKRNKVILFSKVLGIYLPPTALSTVTTTNNTNTVTSTNNNNKVSLSHVLKEHYKEEFIYAQEKTAQEMTNNNNNNTQTETKNLAAEKIRLYSSKAILPVGVEGMISTAIDNDNKNSITTQSTTNKSTKVSVKNTMNASSSDSDTSSSDSDSDSSSSDSDSSDDDDDIVDSTDKASSRSLFTSSFVMTPIDEKPSRDDLVTQVQFSPCGRYISTLDGSNKIRLYQLLDKCFTPSMVHVQTISAAQDDSIKSNNIVGITTTDNNNTVGTVNKNATTSTKNNTATISSYQLLPTVADLKQSHLTTTIPTKYGGDDSNQLFQGLNTKKVLEKMLGPNRIDRVLKVMFKWALACAQHSSSSADSFISKATAAVAAPKAAPAKASSLFKKSTPLPAPGTAVAPAAAVAATTTASSSSKRQKLSNGTDIPDGFTSKADEAVDDSDDDDDYNAHSILTAGQILSQLNPDSMVQLGNNNNNVQNNDENNNPMGDEDDMFGTNFNQDEEKTANATTQLEKATKTYFQNLRKSVRVDLEGYNPYHLLSELLHLLLLSQFTTPISRLFLRINRGKKTNSDNFGNVFSKLIKEKITSVVDLHRQSSEKSGYLFSTVNFDDEMYPSICGSYTNGHYFVYDSNSRSYLGYDSTRPQEIGMKNSHNSTQNIASIVGKDDITDGTTRNHLLQSTTNNKDKDDDINNITKLIIDPLLPPKRRNYYSQVMPFKETSIFNELNPNVPTLLHSDISPIFSTSQHTNYRPLVSFDNKGSLSNPNVLGGLLSSFNVIFATNDDSYTLSLPLHRVYPSVFKNIISSAYYQVIDVILVLERLNSQLINASLDKKNKNDDNFVAATTLVQAKDIKTTEQSQNATKRKRGAVIDATNNIDNNNKNGKVGLALTHDDIHSASLLKIAQLNNINHQQRIELLMVECLSLLPVQRLRSIGRYRPLLYFSFIHSQPAIEIGAMKSLFYHVNNVMSTYYNFEALPVLNKKGDSSSKKLNHDGSDSDDGDNSDDNDYTVGKVNIHDGKRKIRHKQRDREVKLAEPPHQITFPVHDLSTVTLNIPSVVVETPWIQVINSLPAAAYKKKWGQM